MLNDQQLITIMGTAWALTVGEASNPRPLPELGTGAESGTRDSGYASVANAVVGA